MSWLPCPTCSSPEEFEGPSKGHEGCVWPPQPSGDLLPPEDKKLEMPIFSLPEGSASAVFRRQQVRRSADLILHGFWYP